MTTTARREREALCDTLLKVGPEHPTLSGDWTARELAAHLVVRETRPDAAAGMLLPPLRGHLDSVMAATAARPFARLVEQVRQGPPPWHPARVPAVDEAMNTAEMLVHHEDVLRGADPTARRPHDARLQDAAWARLPVIARMTLRGAPIGVDAQAPDRGRRALVGGRDPGRRVLLTGEPVELLLRVFGRGAEDERVTDVEVSGEPQDVAAFREMRPGF